MNIAIVKWRHKFQEHIKSQRLSNPKQFWKLFKRKSQINNIKATPDDLLNHIEKTCHSNDPAHTLQNVTDIHTETQVNQKQIR